jgi:hypothetical protein
MRPRGGSHDDTAIDRTVVATGSRPPVTEDPECLMQTCGSRLVEADREHWGATLPGRGSER